MNNGKFSRKAKRKFNNKSMFVLVSVILITVLAAGMTLAYLSTKSEGIKNIFNPTQVTSKVFEPTFNGTSKSEVPIENTSDVTAYIRAEVVATWMDEEGNVLYKKPILGQDYTMEIGGSWEKEDDGFYYHKTPVEKGKKTGDLIVSAKPAEGKNPQKVDNVDYYLSLEIICSAIQAEGLDDKDNKPIELAWGVDIENGVINPASINE